VQRHTVQKGLLVWGTCSRSKRLKVLKLPSLVLQPFHKRVRGPSVVL